MSLSSVMACCFTSASERSSSFSLAAFNREDITTVQKHFAFVEQAIASADAALLNALHVSYAEGFAWGSPREQSARAMMPPRLGQLFDAMVAWPESLDSNVAA